VRSSVALLRDHRYVVPFYIIIIVVVVIIIIEVKKLHYRPREAHRVPGV
jgi:hypothetical protein